MRTAGPVGSFGRLQIAIGELRTCLVDGLWGERQHISRCDDLVYVFQSGGGAAALKAPAPRELSLLTR